MRNVNGVRVTKESFEMNRWVVHGTAPLFFKLAIAMLKFHLFLT